MAWPFPQKKRLGNTRQYLKYPQKLTHEFSTLIIDFSSNDQAVSIAKDHNAKFIIIPQSEFNHGTARKQLDTDIVVYLTQDFIPVN